MTETPSKKTMSNFRLFSGDLANAVTKIEGINLERGEEVAKEVIALLQLIARQADHKVQSVDGIKRFSAEAKAMIAAIKQGLVTSEDESKETAIATLSGVLEEIKQILEQPIHTSTWLGMEGSKGSVKESPEIKKRMVLLAHKKQSKWQCFLAYSEILLLCDGDKDTAKQLSIAKHAQITTAYLEALEQSVVAATVSQVYAIAKLGEYQKAILLVQVTQMALAHIERMLKESRAMDNAKEIVAASRRGANEEPQMEAVSQSGFFLSNASKTKSQFEALAPLYEDREVTAPVQAKKQPVPDNLAFEWKRFCLAVKYLCMFRSSEERFLVTRLKNEIEEVLTSPYSKTSLKRSQLSGSIAGWRRHYVKRGNEQDIMRDEIVSWGGALMVGLN